MAFELEISTDQDELILIWVQDEVKGLELRAHPL